MVSITLDEKPREQGKKGGCSLEKLILFVDQLCTEIKTFEEWGLIQLVLSSIWNQEATVRLLITSGTPSLYPTLYFLLILHLKFV